MSLSYVERSQATPETNAFYDKAEDRFEMLLNIFKVFGHAPELGTVFTDTVMAILKDGELDWVTKELLILKATHRNECQYCVVQHETLSKRLGISEEKINDIGSDETVLEEFRQRLPRTFALPQIFIDGEHIGSYEDLVIWDREGKLDQLS